MPTHQPRSAVLCDHLDRADDAGVQGGEVGGGEEAAQWFAAMLRPRSSSVRSDWVTSRCCARPQEAPMMQSTWRGSAGRRRPKSTIRRHQRSKAEWGSGRVYGAATGLVEKFFIGLPRRVAWHRGAPVLPDDCVLVADDRDVKRTAATLGAVCLGELDLFGFAGGSEPPAVKQLLGGFGRALVE
jgi:hypothetical protein